ncbi:50S ribosomal protein L6 [Candidatus Parcubacteria bacterium]|nr:50S ribosomal protein L6 [Candidatus Parcubacteria bacterium]
MSRIGRAPIIIPSGVAVSLDGRRAIVRGPKGELKRVLPTGFSVHSEGAALTIAPISDSTSANAVWGLVRALVKNMIIGVSDGFEKRLIIEGVGYRAEVQGRDAVFTLGFSHPVRLTPPEGITVSVSKNIITVAGADKESVGQVAASIRAFKPPEPYKGKGIRYEDEVVRRKAGKKAVASAK